MWHNSLKVRLRNLSHMQLFWCIFWDNFIIYCKKFKVQDTPLQVIFHNVELSFVRVNFIQHDVMQKFKFKIKFTIWYWKSCINCRCCPFNRYDRIFDYFSELVWNHQENTSSTFTEISMFNEAHINSDHKRPCPMGALFDKWWTWFRDKSYA